MWFNSYFPFYTVSPMTGKKLAKYENDIEFQNTFFRNFNLAVSTFQWDGLPPTCNARFLEMCLLLDGCATFVKDTDLGYLTLKAAPVAENYNVYGETDKLYGYGWNGFNNIYTAYMEGSDNTNVQAILVRDNPTMYPIVSHILMKSNRLTSTMRSMDVAVKKLKVPYYITCDESQKSSVQKILDDVEGNVERIIVNRSTAENMFQVFPTRIDPALITRLWEHYQNLETDLRDTLGIPNAVNKDKKERLLVDEVNSNEESTHISLDIRLESRKKACEAINKVFGLNVSVRIRDAYNGEDDADIDDGELLGGAEDE